jgi:3-deoxy-manno-octulosonate cytidylyltransferase (CMP-KDO synthetase)
VASLFRDGKVEIGTLAREITVPDELLNPNTVKVVTDRDGKALYFSRQAIPFVRGADPTDWLKETTCLKHLGIYGYRSDVLKVITELEPGVLEDAEKLEQLRWLENGIGITVAMTTFESPSIDTPEDLSKLTNSSS